MSTNRAGDPPDRAAASNQARPSGPRKESAGVVTPPSGPRPGSLDPTVPFVRPGSGDPVTPRKGSGPLKASSHDAPTVSDTGDRTGGDAPSSGRSKMPAYIGKYQILEKVGKGGMGVLYRGVDPVLDREVAVKLMLGEFSDGDTQLRARFYREARAAAKLQHRNIVTVFEFAEDGTTPYIVMEYLRGMSLAQRLETAPPLTLDDKLDIVTQLCAGLSYAHGQGVVHRDVKPANILLLEDGTVKLLDFGIAKVTTSNLTRHGEVLGSPSYMSPEHVLGCDSMDGRADIFSTGVVLYELLAGRKPFHGEVATAIVIKILNEDPPPLEQFVPDLPHRLVAIVRRALERNRDDRYPTAAELSRELQLVRRTLKASDLQTVVTPAMYPPMPTPSGARATPGTPMSVSPSGALATPFGMPAPAPSGAPPSSIWSKPWVIPASIAAGFVALIAVVVPMLNRQTPPSPGTAPPAAQRTATTPPEPADASANAAPAVVPAVPPAAPTKGTTAAVESTTLRITSDPAGAAIILDGRDTRQVTPAAVVVRGTAPHRLRLSKRGFQSFDTRIAAADLQQGQVSYNLSPSEAPAPAATSAAAPVAASAPPPPAAPAEAMIAVTATGPYAFEVLDGNTVLSPAGTSHQLNVASGKRLRLVARQYSYNQTVTVLADEDRHIELRAPALGWLTIRSALETCRVRIGDRDLGYPPINRAAMAAGSYQIDLVCPNGQNKTGFATVSPGQTLTAKVP